ncbi:MAG TPA: hypothetical protein VM869_03805, partial [Enhygromyxa sp.]|nr:hypothetical protein [Enhygromyxa sp.]
WETLVESLRAAVSAVLRPIQAFIDAARTAITNMLRAAAAVAHAIVDHARRQITTVLTHVRTSLEVMADNLPGEFGEIARRWEQRIDTALTEAQSLLDRWADRVHALIDEGTDTLAGVVQRGLDRLVEGLETAASGLDALLGGGLLAFLRTRFPTIAGLIDRGLLGPIQDATALIDDWVQGLLERSGLLRLQTALQAIEQQHTCGEMTEELHADLCESFDELLDDVIAEFDELLDSPFAREIRAAVEQANREELENQTSVIADLFAFGQAAASTLLEWWNQIEGAVTELYNTLGSYACAAWRHIAEFLGLPLDLDPLTALRQALERLWERAIAAVQPIIDRAVELWRWLREETFLADIIAMIEQIRAGWRMVVRLWDWLLAEGESWLAEMAEQLQTSVIDPLLAMFRSLGDFVRDAIDSLGAFVRGLVRRFDAALAWLGRMLGLESLVALLMAILRPLRTLGLFVFDCFLFSLRGFAWIIANVDRALRTVFDILVGLVMALLAPPMTILAFLGGFVWVYLIPQCMKGPIIDFILTILLRIVDFIPVPNNPILAAIQAGMQGILTALLEADTEQKVRAVDLIARIFAGDVEIGAGMLVGFLEAVWDSTIGLVITLLQALGWVFSWSLESVGLLSSEPDEEHAAVAETGSELAPEDELVPEAELDAELEPAPTGDDVEFGAPTDDDVRTWERGDSATEEDSTGSASAGFDPTRPPELPEEITQIREFLQAFVDSRITAEELQAFLLDMRERLLTVVREQSGNLTRSALSRMNAEGTGYEIGHAIGYVYGLVIVIVVLAILTGGVGSVAVGGELTASSAAGAAARGAATVARSGGTFASAAMRALQTLRSIGTPLLRGLNSLRGTRLGPLITRLEQWFARMMEWLRPLLGRARRIVDTIRTAWNSLPDWLRDDATTWALWRAHAATRARLAWTQLEGRMDDAMISRDDLERLLFALRIELSRGMPRGTRLQFRVETEPERDRWYLEARVRQSLFSSAQHWTMRLLSASSRSGPGWYATDQQGDPWFSTAEPDLSRYERVVQAADGLIERALVHAMGEGAMAPRELHDGIEDEMDGIEEEAGRWLLDNVRIFIDEDQFETITQNGVTQLIYDYVISPNSTRGQIAASLPPSQWSGTLPRTRVGYSRERATSEFGTGMVANPLSREGEGGTEASTTNDTWDALRKRLSAQGGRTYYIRGHLLNADLYGPGHQWRNISIITQEANARHEREVERRVKAAVLDRGHVVRYRVEAV